MASRRVFLLTPALLKTPSEEFFARTAISTILVKPDETGFIQTVFFLER